MTGQVLTLYHHEGHLADDRLHLVHVHIPAVAKALQSASQVTSTTLALHHIIAAAAATGEDQHLRKPGSKHCCKGMPLWHVQ